MIRRPPRSTRTDTLFPYTTLFRSALGMVMFVAALMLASTASVAADSVMRWRPYTDEAATRCGMPVAWRSEEHTSELQSLMRISYAVFCLKKKKEIHKNKDYS